MPYFEYHKNDKTLKIQPITDRHPNLYNPVLFNSYVYMRDNSVLLADSSRQCTF